MPFVVNHQLFAEDYIQEIGAAKIATDIPDAARQTIREWRDEYPNLDCIEDLILYLSQCLSSLEFSYSIEKEPDRFILFSDETHSRPLGICLVVQDDQIGRMKKGRHHQAMLIRLLKESQLKWGMVTNGLDWRLCNAGASAPYEVYLDGNVECLLDPRQLKEFILFFRFFNRKAFDIVEEQSGQPAVQNLDRMLAESDEHTQAIERHLKTRVEQVLQNLCLGFVADQDKDRLERDDLDEIYRNAIYLLYRMLFLFYAEARRLLPVDHPVYRKISLASIIETAFSQRLEGQHDPDQYSLWKRLTRLCVVVDDGEEAADVRPYNGGLFSDSEKPYLQNHKIADEFLSQVIFDLAFVETKNGPRQIDYRDLSVRHLGTLYEGMLEYRLNLVTDEPVVVRISKDKRTYIPQSVAGAIKKGEIILDIGQVYFADDKGERKSSGSYYTPEDVVQYIISNTLLPKMQERTSGLRALLEETQKNLAVSVTPSEKASIEGYADRKALEIVEKELLGLRILDPAMGSAHFLVAAGQMLTNFVVEMLNTLDWPNDDISTDPLLWKRRVVERCLYGVDINPLAQELAKLALWLTSASEGKPLTFLDHHLKVGNSLYGAPLAQLTTLPKVGKSSASKAKKTAEQTSNGSESENQGGFNKDAVDTDLFQQQFQRILQEVLYELSRITTSDSDRIEDVKNKGEAYEIAQSKALRLCDLANVWLGSLRGLLYDNDEPLSTGQYFDIVQKAIKDEAVDEWEFFVENNKVLQAAREIGRDEKFFHWELEFVDSLVDSALAFDIVVANPPYVKKTPDRVINTLFQTAKCGDLYAWIVERGLNLLSPVGGLGTIIPLSIIFAGDKRSLRKLMIKQKAITHLISCDNTPDSIFGDSGYNRQRATIVTLNKSNVASPLIFTTSHLRWASSERYLLFKKLRFGNVTKLCSEEYFPMIDDDRLVEFFIRLLEMNYRIKNITSENKKHFLCIPSVACYFISAVPEDLLRRNQEFLWFEEDFLQQYAFAVLNSNVFYWYWRSRSDGFWVSRQQILSMPIPKVEKENLQSLLMLASELWQGAEIENSKKMGDKQVKNYYFNKKMEILLNIDDWIVEHIAPDLNLPRGIFAQYKSNSFLKLLDLDSFSLAEVNSEEMENTE